MDDCPAGHRDRPAWGQAATGGREPAASGQAARALGDVGFVLPEWGFPPRWSMWLAVLPVGWPGGLELTPCLYTVEKAARCLHAVNHGLVRLAPELAETWSAREARNPEGGTFRHLL